MTLGETDPVTGASITVRDEPHSHPSALHAEQRRWVEVDAAPPDTEVELGHRRSDALAAPNRLAAPDNNRTQPRVGRAESIGVVDADDESTSDVARVCDNSISRCVDRLTGEGAVGEATIAGPVRSPGWPERIDDRRVDRGAVRQHLGQRHRPSGR